MSDEAQIIGNIRLTEKHEYPTKAIVRTKKGSAGAESYTLLRVMVPPEEVMGLLGELLNESGNLVFESWVIREGINAACNEATAEAWQVDPETGEYKVDEDKFRQTFRDYFVPSDRRRGGGVTLKDLLTRLQAVQPEFTAAVERHREQEQAYIAALQEALANKRPAPNQSDYISEEVINRSNQLLQEVIEINAAIEKKQRGNASRKGSGRPPGSKNKPKTEEAATEASE